MYVDAADLVDVVVVGTESDSFSMLLRPDMIIVIFVMFLADGAPGVLGVGPGENLLQRGCTSWFCFSRESLICF